MTKLETNDIQGLILSGYGHLPYYAFLFLSFENPTLARAWLADLANRVTTSMWASGPDGKVIKPVTATNIALTYAGLRALGLSDDCLRTFPQEFQEGMAADSRARRMGDIGASDPKLWEFGGSADAAASIHALLILQAPNEGSLGELCASESAAFSQHGIREVAARHTTHQDPDKKEHFGFRDSISQPDIEGGPNTGKQRHGCIKAGEFVLGYPNEYGVLSQTPSVPAAQDGKGRLQAKDGASVSGSRLDLGRNGSFLVFRKLYQDVAAFRRFLRDHSDGPQEETLLGAKMVGRWPGGAPLTLSPAHDDPTLSTANQFGYATHDALGFHCPAGAHIRRSNPRDSLEDSGPAESQKGVNRHRMLRRGVVYGERLPDGVQEDDGNDRGILFLCVVSDIERQFEFVQQNWVNTQKLAGMYSDSDPIAGPNADPMNVGDTGPWTFTVPCAIGRRRITGVPRFVKMRGGGYFFLPSINAIRFLGDDRD